MSRRAAGQVTPTVSAASATAPASYSSFDGDDDELVTGEAVGLDVRPAGFVLRLAGVAIDYVAYALVLVGLIIVVAVSNSRSLIDDSTSTALVVGSIVICLVGLPTAIETATRGRSLGKVIVGARVVRLDGGAIGFRHAFTRALVGLLEIVTTTGGVAVVVGLLNSRSRRLGDLLAGTYALNVRPPQGARVVYGVPSILEAWSRVADVARLPDSLARRMSAFLQQAPRLSPESRVRLAGQLAEEASAFVSPLPQVDAETFVAGVSAVRRKRETVALLREAAALARLAPALTGVPEGFPHR